MADEDRDALAEAIRLAVKVGHIGPNSAEIIGRGGRVALTSGEAEEAADNVLASDWLRDHDAALTANAKAEAWEVGYLRGTLDATSDLHPADNPYAEDGDGEVAEMLTHQECAAKKHPDWFIDSEHNLTCPWCAIDDLRARLAKVEALRDEYARVVRAAESLDPRTPGLAEFRQVIDDLRAAIANPDAAGEGRA